MTTANTPITPNDPSISPAPLSGIRVLDLSKVLAGPLCAQYLGDMGADVIKIETPEQGDETRHWPPFREAGDDSVGAVFLSANRNKRSLCLDLKTEQGREVVYRLAKWADVAIASFGPDVAEKLGVDAKTLRDCNPRLIYCDISGFGRIGPMRDGKGYDVILQSFTGMLSITGEPKGPPVRSPFSPVDQATGQVGPDPLDLLRSYRAKPALDGAICFGMNCIVVEGDRQTISIGQQVDVELAFL